MKRPLIMLLLLLGSAGLASARDSVKGWCEEGNRPVVTSGLNSTTRVQASHPSCTITVYVHGGGLATIYADNNSTPLANPFTAQSGGRWQAYADNGRYDVTMSSAGFSQTVTYSDIILCDPFEAGSTCNNGGQSSGHNLLSDTHLDTVPFSPPVQGDVITAQTTASPTGVTPAWNRLALGTLGQVLYSTGTDAIWGSLIAGTGITITPGSSGTTIASSASTTITINGSTCTVGSTCNSGHHGLEFTIYNGGTALTSGTGTASYALMAAVPFKCTITSYSLAADQGTATVKFWKVATGTAIPVVGNSINTSGVSLSTGTKIDSSTLSDFTTTAIAVNDSIIMDITAVAGGMTYLDGVLGCSEPAS
jgi:hypothetical protein